MHHNLAGGLSILPYFVQNKFPCVRHAPLQLTWFWDHASGDGNRSSHTKGHLTHGRPSAINVKQLDEDMLSGSITKVAFAAALALTALALPLLHLASQRHLSAPGTLRSGPRRPRRPWRPRRRRRPPSRNWHAAMQPGVWYCLNSTALASPTCWRCPQDRAHLSAHARQGSCAESARGKLVFATCHEGYGGDTYAWIAREQAAAAPVADQLPTHDGQPMTAKRRIGQITRAYHPRDAPATTRQPAVRGAAPKSKRGRTDAAELATLVAPHAPAGSSQASLQASLFGVIQSLSGHPADGVAKR